MSTGTSKRVVAEIRFGEDRAGVAKVGGRSIHQYWSLLSPHFRDVFLAPQRRSDDGGVSWTWRESAEKPPLTAPELAAVRNRLVRAKESFEENPVNPLMSEARGGGASSQEIIDQLTARVKALAEGLAGKPDAALAEFVCRTETGVMVHSWGLAAAAKTFYPDSLESGVGGVVMFGGKGSVGNEVVIENAKGLRVARATTDEAGEFSFTKIAPGRYRLRVISGPGEFSAKGVSANVERGEMTRVELRSTNDPEAPAAESTEDSAGQSATDTSAPVAAKKRRTWVWAAVLAVLLLLGGGGWVWRANFRSDESDMQTTQRISTLTPEKFSSAKPAVSSEEPARSSSRVGSELGAVIDGPAGSKSSTASHETPSLGVPAFSSIPGAATGSVSKIGTRVELSSVKTSGASSASGSANLARGMKGSASASQVSTGTSSGLAETPAGAETDTLGENSQKAQAVSAKPMGETRSGTGGVPAETLSGQMPAGSGGAMPESPAGSEEEKKQGMAEDTGLSSDEKKQASSKMAGLPASARAKKGVSPESNIPVSSVGGTALAEPVNKLAAGQGPNVAVTVVEKTSDKSEAKASSTDAGQPANTPADDSSAAASPDDPAARPEKPRSRKEPKTVAKTSKPVSRAGSDNSASSAASPPASAIGSSTKGEPAKNEKSETSDTANESSTASPEASPSDGATNQAPALSPDRSEEQKPGRASRSSSSGQTKPRPAALQVLGTVRLGEWAMSIGRDAIVPTEPLRDGEKDLTEMLRRKMIEEQKARLPATLRRPKLTGGFAFKFAAGAKAQPLHWLVEDRLGLTMTVQDNRAEIGWPLTSAPREGAFTLAYSDGTEVARIEFDHEGRATVAVRAELRGVFLLGAMYAEADFSDAGVAPRVAWQVVRGPLASTAWAYDSRWLNGTGCRLEVVLNGANPSHTRIALIDQTSGWQLATELE